MNIKNLLADLQKDYLNSIPEKIANLIALRKSGHLEDLRTEFHKLKGTGRTYGLPEITQIGGAIEVLCDHPELFAISFPLSIHLLEKIRVSRVNGQAFKIEEDRDFQVIAELVLGIRHTA